MSVALVWDEQAADKNSCKQNYISKIKSIYPWQSLEGAEKTINRKDAVEVREIYAIYAESSLIIWTLAQNFWQPGENTAQ